MWALAFLSLRLDQNFYMHTMMFDVRVGLFFHSLDSVSYSFVERRWNEEKSPTFSGVY